jgi:hypothetical protein
LERIFKDKPSSLLGLVIDDEEKRVFIGTSSPSLHVPGLDVLIRFPK